MKGSIAINYLLPLAGIFIGGNANPFSNLDRRQADPFTSVNWGSTTSVSFDRDPSTSTSVPVAPKHTPPPSSVKSNSTLAPSVTISSGWAVATETCSFRMIEYKGITLDKNAFNPKKVDVSQFKYSLDWAVPSDNDTINLWASIPDGILNKDGKRFSVKNDDIYGQPLLHPIGAGESSYEASNWILKPDGLPSALEITGEYSEDYVQYSYDGVMWRSDNHGPSQYNFNVVWTDNIAGEWTQHNLPGPDNLPLLPGVKKPKNGLLHLLFGKNSVYESRESHITFVCG